MRKNLSALNKKHFVILLIAAFFALGIFLAAQEAAETGLSETAEPIKWYRSNASGLAIEMIPSRLAALRYEYCLSVESIASRRLPGVIPRNIIPYYENGYRVEFRQLYENGAEIRRQWIFRDSKGLARISASGSPDFFSPVVQRVNEDEDSDEAARKGFIEIRNSAGYVTRELQYDEDLSEWEFRYTYRENVLIRAETWLKGPPLPPPVQEVEVLAGLEDEAEAPLQIVSMVPVERKEPVLERLFTDSYRYTRSGSLRAIDRTIQEGTGERSRIGFPALSPRITPREELATHAGVYTTAYFLGAGNLEGLTVNYNLDSRGRVLSEITKNDEGKTVGELRNTWSDNRLTSAFWKSGDDERRIEFEYDNDGEPVVERNFRKGVLERVVNIEGDNEIEEIYMNGNLILRAYWENGLKISEERIGGSGGSPR
jgi:hypothetical protein